MGIVLHDGFLAALWGLGARVLARCLALKFSLTWSTASPFSRSATAFFRILRPRARASAVADVI